MRRVLPLFALLVACAEDTSLDDGARDRDDALPSTDDAEDTPSSTCAARVAWVEPDDGDTWVGVDTSIVVGFTEPLPPEASWSLEVVGIPGAAALSVDRTSATFLPDAALPHEATVEVLASACRSARSASFRTLPAPVDVRDLRGRAWRVGPEDLTWLGAIPTLVAPLLGFEVAALELAPDRDAPGALRLSLAHERYPGTPLACVDRLDLGRIDLSANPRFTTPPTDIASVDATGEVQLAEVIVSGQFGHRGDALVDVRFQGLVDTRPLEDLGPFDGLCTAAALMGDPCGPCADGAMACLTAVVTLDDVWDVGDRELDALRRCE